jgi:hypothetical protein
MVAAIHPRLFHALVLLDPVIYREPNQWVSESGGERTKRRIEPPLRLSTYRRDLWPSREAASESFKNSFYQTWDPRVLDRWVKHGLRELPTALYPQPQSALENGNRPVTLTTTRHQEVFSYSRPNYDYDPTRNPAFNTLTHPDLNIRGFNPFPFYRPEPLQVFAQLPYLRPSVLYIFGGMSYLSTPEMCQDRLGNTGIDVGGSGGVAAGRVRSICFESHGHLLPLEVVNKCADAAVDFLGVELERWRVEEEVFQVEWKQKSKLEKITIDDRWKAEIGPPPAKKQTKL